MSTYATIGDFIVEVFKADTTIAAAVGGRVHYGLIPQTSDYPHIYVARQGKVTDKLLDGSLGIVQDRFVIEVVGETFDDELVTAVEGTLLAIEGIKLDEDLTIATSDLGDVSDDYVMQSADSDALLMHAFVLTLYLGD